ncbi:hypothetical protein D3C78_615960 [compost metagenome]
MYRSVAINQSHGFWATLKRTLFVASLYFRLIRDYNPDDSILAEFNRLFYLVNDPQSLTFPAMVCPILWKDEMVKKVVKHCEDGDFKQAVELVYGTMPKWLRYLDRETMLRDVERVLRQSQRREQTA